MRPGGGGRFNQTPSISSTERQKVRDTTHQVIGEVSFDQLAGNYEESLINILRRYLSAFNPSQSDAVLIRIVFTEANGRQLATYINSFSVYLVGIRMDDDVVFEFGKYPEYRPTEPKESEKKRNKNKSSEIYGKPKTDEKEKRMAGLVKERQLPGSHLLGFDEGYGGSGITSPRNVTFGRQNLIKAIKEICAGYHKPEYNITKDVCFTWRDHLTVITVMVCEAARFHPMCWYFSKLITEEIERSLLDWLDHIINKWSAMSKMLRGINVSIACSQETQNGFNDLTLTIVKELCEDKDWVEKVLAITCRAK